VAASNLVSRLATAAVGVPALLALLYLGPAWGLYLLVAVAGCVGAFELFSMTHPTDRTAQFVGVLTCLITSVCVYFFNRDALVMMTVLLTAPLLGMLMVLWRLGDIKTTALRVMAGTFGPLYVGGCLTTLALLRKEQPGFDGAGYVVLALGLAWASDTGGYFAGRRFGRHKLYEAVSPKKTIEGSVGGVMGAVVIALVAHFWFLKSLPLVHAIVLAVVGALLGQLGDLGESLLKRSTGVKDSGAILPGHGGILDRVDALMITSTVVYLYTRWMVA
jgi:phosphatidate cytidylyltransferase